MGFTLQVLVALLICAARSGPIPNAVGAPLIMAGLNRSWGERRWTRLPYFPR
ncbi:hypothetical protein E2562_011923, partial [Oryza meyeriana var. granulata]